MRFVTCGWMRHVDRSRHITQVIVRTLLSVTPVLISDRQCFELFGFDVMLDSGVAVHVIP